MNMSNLGWLLFVSCFLISWLAWPKPCPNIESPASIEVIEGVTELRINFDSLRARNDRLKLQVIELTVQLKELDSILNGE